MNKLEAKNLVFNTFENSFDESRFTYFVRNLLNNLDESKSQTWAGNYIPESFRNSIKYYKRIGQYIAKDKNVLDVLIVNVKRDNTLERARTLQRNFIARHLKQRNHEAALVAFYTEGYDDWRFSLVKVDFNLNKSKVEIELSPAKRYSFLVGANERSHTAQSQFQKILTEIPNPTLNDLEQAFNIETVTREFFLEYRNLFIRTKLELDKVLKNDAKLKTEFDSKNVNSVDFSKKLLGQIIFLYFLQKKGWFGVERDSDWGTGSKKFLRELFNLSAEVSAKAEKKHGVNFFNDYLEPLFYEALRMDRSHDDHYYSRFNCKIPFLNGGLFDPIGNYDWVHTDINLPNELFSNDHKTKEGDIGDGILDIFDRYNFTVIEDEPLEKEVAIDPELLGKAYEKFNAIRPDNFDEYTKALKSGKKGEENKFNKQYGVYYTPREIVHYMCRESLINYLSSEFSDKTDAYQKVSTEQLDAFGNTTRKGQLALEAEYKPNPYIQKEDIETLINYGELLGENEAIVESKGKETETYYHKLPESIRKNAKLIDEKLSDILICDPAVGSGAFPVGMMHEIVGARNLLSIFIKESGRTIYNFKRECIEKSLYGVDIDSGAVEIAKLRLWLSLVVDEDDFKEIKPLPNLDYKIVCGNSLFGVEKNIFNNEYFEQLEKLKTLHLNETNPNKKQEFKNQIDGLILKISDGHKDFDFEVYFSEVFHQKKGFDVVIGNPPWVSLIGKQAIEDNKRNKKFLLKLFPDNTYMPNLYEYFILKAMTLLDENGVLTFIVPDRLGYNASMNYLRKKIIKSMILREIIYRWKFENIIADTMTIVATNRKTDENYFIKTKHRSDAEFLQLSKDTLLSDVDCVFKSYESKAIMALVFKIKNDSIELKTICSVTSGFGGKSELISSVKLNNRQIEILKGSSIDKYLRKEKLYFEFIDKNITGRTRDENKLSIKEKLLLRKTGSKLIATYDNSGIYPEQSLYFLYNFKNNVNIKYVLAIINSKLMNWYYLNELVTNIDSTPQLKTFSLESFPIRITNQTTFITLVNNILSTKQQNPQANTKPLEDQIDIMVYKLYNLTYEEVKIIDPEIEKLISEEEYEKYETK